MISFDKLQKKSRVKCHLPIFRANNAFLLQAEVMGEPYETQNQKRNIIEQIPTIGKSRIKEYIAIPSREISL